MAYNPYPSGSANAIASPAHIKCKDCNIKKPKSAFSKKQLADLATHMQRKPFFKPEIQGHVICIGCSPKQVVELHCLICDLDKGLDRFSKAQRKTPDTAICWSCAQERDNYEPGEQDGDRSSGGSDFDESDASDDTYSVADTVSNSVRSTLPATLSSRGGVSLPSTSNAPTSRGGGWGSSSSAASTTTTSTAAGGAFQSVTSRSNMTASSTVFQASKYKPSAASTPVKTGGAAFAKVKAKPRTVRYDVNNEDRQHHSGGEDDDVNLTDSE
ncbi:uncharacterized protein SEPMUDRAFT_146556 [Sphaerulina musiva SO2202]|uniref:Stc1 domain-containing protein n=1 Tax=Sphaerulina musiva (strain SO2202) TaxID=692275 RepID=N1QMI8_SPHMS|nr:uncharacterized protein SEPMUDRAFT_146556 [Sphaerulina musiva SO2202]EMF17572.1 hypothetical protein SEPMUDRAFT_146556 [Sphaerulina musiva SO2202]